jgi:hypothetical protein
VPVAGVVVSQSTEEPVPLAQTRETMQRFGGSTPIVTLSRDGTITGDQRPYDSLLEALLLIPSGG